MEQQPSQISSEAERQLGHQIIAEELGENFRLNFDMYAPSVGVKGDERVHGEAVEIEYLLDNPLKFFVENQELLAKVSNRITNELPTIIRVAFFMLKKEG